MPKSKRGGAALLAVALAATGTLAVTAAAATITGGPGQDRIVGTPDAM